MCYAIFRKNSWNHRSHGIRAWNYWSNYYIVIDILCIWNYSNKSIDMIIAWSSEQFGDFYCCWLWSNTHQQIHEQVIKNPQNVTISYTRLNFECFVRKKKKKSDYKIIWKYLFNISNMLNKHISRHFKYFKINSILVEDFNFVFLFFENHCTSSLFETKLFMISNEYRWACHFVVVTVFLSSFFC